MRVLVVTNMRADPARPALGRFIRDQVDALQGLGIEVERFDFAPGTRQYIPATRRLRALLREAQFDLVHAHYGLAGWCARLAGASPLIVTFHGTDVRHRVVGPLSRRLAPRLDLVATASRALFAPEAGRPGLPRGEGRNAVLPCGPDLARFAPRPRADARRSLGLDAERRYLLFPADPERQVKRADRAREVAALAGAELLTGGAIEPERMPDWMNAADAVIVSSENEGFGLVALEALACDVAVLSTPVGAAPLFLRGVEGCLVEPFDAHRWAGAVRGLLERPDPRVQGRERARAFSAERTAERVAVAYKDVLGTRAPAGLP